MDWLKLILGSCGAFLLSCGLLLLKKVFEVYQLKKEYAKLPIQTLSEIKTEGRVRVKGCVRSSSLVLRSYFTDKKGFYFHGRIANGKQAKYKKPWNGYKRTNFTICDGSDEINVHTKDAKFIVKHIRLSPDEVKDGDIPAQWQNNIQNAVVMEEFLEKGDWVNILGDCRKEDGRWILKGDKKKPLMVIHCSDEAFQLIHMRFLIRTLLLSVSLIITALIQILIVFYL